MLETRSAVRFATVTAAAMMAFHVGGKATRDAMFLSSFGVRALPSVMVVTAFAAIVLSIAATRVLLRWGPARLMPVAFVASASLILIEWGMSIPFPKAAAVLVYLHYGCLGALLVSGYWSFMNERFDPRTAKRELGRITTGGSVGGLLGGLAAAAVGQAFPVAAMLPVLAAFHLVCGLALVRLAPGQVTPTVKPAPAPAPESHRRGPPVLRVLAGSSYVRGLLSFVFLAAVTESLIDLVFKGRAATAFGAGGGLLRFFAIFYTSASLLALGMQAILSRIVLEKLGPARSAAIHPAALVAATAGGIVAPGLTTATIARGTESVLSSSLYRPGYEVLFIPVAASERRATKTIADVGAVRIGDMLAAGAGQAFLLFGMSTAGVLLTALSCVTAIAALFVALRLHAGYVASLERGLLSRAVHLDLDEIRDSVTRSLMQTVGGLGRTELRERLSKDRVAPAAHDLEMAPPSARAPAEVVEEGETASRRHDLDSRDPERVIRALRSGPLSSDLVPRAVSLLAWDQVAREAIEALRGSGSEAVPVLVARLGDPDEEFAARRRIPLVLGTCPDARAVDGLLRALTDSRFEVRYRAGRALNHLLDTDRSLSVPYADAVRAIAREVEAGAGVWAGRRLLDSLDDDSWSPVMDQAVRDRADRSLEHVFTLLGLILPRQPLRIAFRGLHTNDPLLRGTALEYLETVLPPEIRKPLWPHLEDESPRRRERVASAEAALEQLLRSNESISARLEELRGRPAAES